MAHHRDNKRNWLYRLKHLKIRKQSVSTNNVNEDVFYHSNSSVQNNGSLSRYQDCDRTPNGLRGSIMKMHTRFKSIFRNRDNNNRIMRNASLNSVSTPSLLLQSRVTLSSPTQNVENTYSIEPVKDASSRTSLNEESLRLPLQINSVPEGVASLNSTTAPIVPPRRRNFPQLSTTSQNGRVPKNEVASLLNHYWYWGPISRGQTEERLKDSPDGAFLVRDSTADRYLFTMSFKNIGKILHTRIDYSKSGYSLFDQVGYNSIAELVEDAVAKSKNGVYCYTKTKDEIHPNFPVRLTLPVSRYDEVPSLRYLSRFVIRQFVNINDMDKLPLPVLLINYLQEEGQYF